MRLISLCLVLVCAHRAQEPPTVTVERVASFPYPLFPKHYSLSRGGTRFACWYTVGEKRTVQIDGVTQGDYDQVGTFVFSKDEIHVAFVAKDGGKALVIHDGRKVGEYNEAKGLSFNPVTKELVCFATNNVGKWFLIQSGKEVESFDQTGLEPVFSQDGTSCGYTFIKDGKRWVAAGDRKFGPYSFVAVLRMGRGKDDVAFITKNDEGKSQLHWNDKSLGVWDDISSDGPVMAPDGSDIAYIVTRGEQKLLGRGSRTTNDFRVYRSLQFSPDGKKLAYIGERDGLNHLVVDDKIQASAAYINHFKWDNASNLAWVEERGGLEYLRCFGLESAGYKQILIHSISRKSELVSYRTYDGKGFSVRIGDRKDLNGASSRAYMLVGESRFVEDNHISFGAIQWPDLLKVHIRFGKED